MNLVYDTNNYTGYRHAVIDIGSNSVRLVIYLIVGKTFIPIHNEKVLAALGRGISETGKLYEPGVALALNSIKRYKLLIDNLKIESVDAIATAASRDASDGAEFIAYIKNVIGIPVRLIDGSEEGYYSSIGVKSGTTNATGIMGDLGGSSLELVDLKSASFKESHKLGPLAIGDIASIREIAGNVEQVRKAIRSVLEKSQALKLCNGDEFHAVGGAWRNLAQMHMDHKNYPLKVLNNYTIDGREMREFCNFVIRLSRKTIEKVRGISQRRADSLPYAALLMSEIIEIGKPKEIVISSYGLREGVLTDHLGFNENPLSDGIRAILHLDKAALNFTDEAYKWLVDFLPLDVDGISEVRQKELLNASCALVNIGMGLHPDHRGQLAYELVLRAPYPAASHNERVFLAHTIARRYGEKPEDIAENESARLLNSEYAKIADFFGSGLRLASSLASNSGEILKQTRLVRMGNNFHIELPERLRDLISDSVIKRLKQLEQQYQKLINHDND